MLKNILIGGAVLVGGYLVYTKFIKPKTTATSTTTATGPVTYAVYDSSMYREGPMSGGFSGARIEIAR